MVRVPGLDHRGAAPLASGNQRPGRSRQHAWPRVARNRRFSRGVRVRGAVAGLRDSDHGTQSRHRHRRAVLFIRRRLRDRAARRLRGGRLRGRRRDRRMAPASSARTAMTTLMATILGAWFITLFLGPTLYALMGLAGFAFLVLAGIPGIVIPQKIAMAANSFPLLAAPLFILMGNVMNTSGISYRIFDFAKAVVGWMRGGLCQANIIGSVIFAGMSGSAVADAAGLGTVEIAAMKKEGYDAETAGAITAASATIGPIIPPSLPMIVYGVAAETSVGALFIAGVIPGLLMAVALMIMVRSLSIKQDMPRHPFEGFGELWRSFRRAFWAIVAPFLLIGGMFSGVFTPTEAAAVAVVYALVLGLFVYREFTWRDLPKLILDTVETTGVVMALVMTATLLGYCLTVARIPQEFGGWLTALSTNPLVYLLIVNVLLLVVGCFMEALAA